MIQEAATDIKEVNNPEVKVDGVTTQGEVLPQTSLEIDSLVSNPNIARVPEGAPITTSEYIPGQNFNPVAGEVPKSQPDVTPGQVGTPTPTVEGGIRE